MKFYILLMGVISIVCANDTFQTNKVERNLMNPKRTLEFSGAIAYPVNNSDDTHYMLNANYSFTDNFQLSTSGVSYKFLQLSNSEFVAGVDFVSYSSSTSNGNSTKISADITGKSRLVKNVFAFNYQILYTNVFNSANDIDDGYLIDYNIEPLVAFNDYFSIGIKAGYRQGNETIKDYYVSYMNFSTYVNVNKNLEFFLNYAPSDLLNYSSYLYSNSYILGEDGNTITAGITARFFF